MQLKKIVQAVRFMGLKWLLYRIFYELNKNFGFFEKNLFLKDWLEIHDYTEDLKALRFISLPFIEEGFLKDLGIKDAESLIKGDFQIFGFHRKRLGFCPDWFLDPTTGIKLDAESHWSRINDFGNVDIKCVWELNRFSWAFTLARAYARTGREDFPERFWQLFENWCDQNLPNQGCNWKCGQEASFRLFAAAFARRVFSEAKATTPDRLLKWRKFVVFTAERIYGNISYALSQKNNHGISECVGLITAVRLLPSMPKAREYLDFSQKMLAKQLQELVYADGGFSQHSTVYHRVLMNDLTWYLALENSAGERVDENIVAAAERALKFMVSITDLETGLAPLHGPNDGSDILPLTSCDYLDLRPCILALSKVLGYEIDLPSGAYDEVGFWINTPEKTRRKLHVSKEGFRGGESGYNFIYSNNSRLFCFAPQKFYHRPSQADLLHVDLWWKGLPITRDPGSYSYNSKGNFSSMLASTNVHNTVTVDNQDQMEKLSKFLYLPWPKTQTKWEASSKTFNAFHNGYRDKGILHKRVIKLVASDEWVVEDELLVNDSGKKKHCFVINWLLTDYSYTFQRENDLLILHTPKGDFEIKIACESSRSCLSLVRGDPESDRGWWSPYYFYLEPALSLQLEVYTTTSQKIITILKPRG